MEMSHPFPPRYVDGKLRESGPTLRAHVMGVDAYDDADDAARYAALLRARHQLPRETVGGGAVAVAARRGEAAWPQIFVALRCGGAAAALAVAETAQNPMDGGPLEPAAVVDGLRARAALDDALEVDGWRDARQRGDLDDKALALAQAATALSRSDRYRTVCMDGEASCPFERFVLNVLCLEDADHRPPTVVKTVEDFCWHRGSTRVIQRRFNMSGLEAMPERNAWHALS